MGKPNKHEIRAGAIPVSECATLLIRTPVFSGHIAQMPTFGQNGKYKNITKSMVDVQIGKSKYKNLKNLIKHIYMVI